ncbi:MAG: acyclic terpene utilization AtuA family protein [Acidimicrobiia bacterium]
MNEVLRIANCSGFYGDRLTAAREMVEGGPIDVLTGDYLAELTLAILWRNRQRDPDLGYASTFVTQMSHVLGTCLERGIKVVSNAGGINPSGLTELLAKLSADLGVAPRLAFVDGDDLLPRLSDLEAAGHPFSHMDRGTPLAGSGVTPLTANAYLGGWGIKEALAAGADVVITGRVTDAALVVGPAAWYFDWGRDDWNALAGAVVAGHVIECGAQCTGGNYAFFEEVPGLERVGFPIAEIHRDGTSVITKHPGTGGLVSVGTVTAQLLYEIGSADYLNPDVTARFDTITLTQQAPERVAVTGVVGAPPPADLKVALNYLGGHRNSMTFGVAGLEIEQKIELLEKALWGLVGPTERFDSVEVKVIGAPVPDPPTNDQALVYVTVSVKGRDPETVGRSFSRAAVELALSSYPGFFVTTPPGEGTSFAVYWPTTIPASLVPMRVVIGDQEWEVSSIAPQTDDGRSATEDLSSNVMEKRPAQEAEEDGQARSPDASVQPTRYVTAPLGLIAGARSGDKGGNANVGFWVRTSAAYQWFSQYLSVERLKDLLPEAKDLRIDRYELPNLLALNFVINGLLGEGVASSTRTDPQAKSLGEFLRARLVEIPEGLIDPGT